MTANEDSNDAEEYTGPRDFEPYAEFLEDMYGDIFEVEYEGSTPTAYDVQKIRIQFEREESHELHQYGVRDTPQKVDITAMRVESHTSTNSQSLLGRFFDGLLNRGQDPDAGYEYTLKGGIVDANGTVTDFPRNSSPASFEKLDRSIRYPLQQVSVYRRLERERRVEAGIVDVDSEALLAAISE